MLSNLTAVDFFFILAAARKLTHVASPFSVRKRVATRKLLPICNGYTYFKGARKYKALREQESIFYLDVDSVAAGDI